MKAVIIAFVLMLVMGNPAFAQDDPDGNPFAQVARVGRGNVWQVIWSPNGDELAIVTTRGVWRYDATLLSDSPFLFAPPALDMSQTDTLAISPSWNAVAGINHDGQVAVWDFDSGEVVFTSEDASSQGRHLAYSPDGALLLAAQNDHWTVWDAETWEIIGGDTYADIDDQFRTGILPAVTQVAFSRDGSHYGIATTIPQFDEVNSVVYVVDSETHETTSIEYQYENGELVLKKALGLDMGLAYAVERIRLDTDLSGRTETVFTILSLYQVDENGRQFVTAFPTDHSDSSFDILMNTIVISPDQNQIAIADRRGPIWVWDIQEAIDMPPCLVTPPTGSTSGSEPDEYDIPGLVSTTCDARWSARVTMNRAHVPPLNNLTTSQTRFDSGNDTFTSGDGHWRLLEPDRDNPVIRLENLDDETITELEVLYPDIQVQDVLFTSDGHYVIASFTTYYMMDVGDTVIRVWQIEDDGVNPVPVAILSGHTRDISSIALSPDERLLVSASYDRTAEVWDTTTWESVAVLQHDIALDSAAFGDDNDTVLTAGRDGLIYVWRRD